MCLCVVLWDLSIGVTVIILQISPEKITRDRKQIHKVVASTCFDPCLSVSLSSHQHYWTATHTNPPPKMPQTTLTQKLKKMLGEQLDTYNSRWHGVQEWHKVYVSSNQELFVCFSLLLCFPSAVFISIASRLHRLIQTDWDWAALSEFSASHI